MSSGSLFQLCTLLAIPFAFGSIFRRQPHALKVKPLNGTVLIVTSNHLTKRNTLTVTVDWLTRVYSCWNCVCHPCIASKRTSQMTEMHSGVCIGPLQPATCNNAPLGQNLHVFTTGRPTQSSLGMSRSKERIAWGLLRFKTDTTCTYNIITSLQCWCCGNVKIPTRQDTCTMQQCLAMSSCMS